MFGHLRRLFRDSVVYGVAETLSRGISTVLIFIYVRTLTEGDLGIRTAVYSASAVIGIFYTLGLDNAFLRYFMDDSISGEKKNVFCTAFYFSALTGLLFLAAAWLFDVQVSHLLTKGGSYEYIIRLMFIILVFDTVIIYPTLVLRAENRMMYYSLIAFTRFFLFILLNILLVWGAGRGLRGVFEANLIVVIIISMMMYPLYRDNLHGHISLTLLKRMLSFGIPTIFTILCMRVIDYSDRLMILYLLGKDSAAELGRYSVAYTLGMIGIMVFVNSFRVAWQPFFLSVMNENDAGSIFSRVATYYTMFIGMVFLGITLFREEIFVIFAPDVAKFPVTLAGIVPVVSFAYIFFGFYIIMLAGIFIREKTRFLPLVTLAAAASNLGLNFIFVPAFGIIGAAYTTIIAYIIMVGLLYIVSHKIYRVNYEFRRLGVVAVLIMIPVVISLVFQPAEGLLNFLYRCILFMIPPCIILLGNFLLPEERDSIRQFLKRHVKFG